MIEPLHKIESKENQINCLNYNFWYCMVHISIIFLTYFGKCKKILMVSTIQKKYHEYNTFLYIIFFKYNCIELNFRHNQHYYTYLYNLISMYFNANAK